MKAEEPAAIPYEANPLHARKAKTAHEASNGNVIFNKAQLYLLELFSRMESDAELEEVKNLLAKHYAKKALDAIDELWEKGEINEDVITPYTIEEINLRLDEAEADVAAGRVLSRAEVSKKMHQYIAEHK